MFLWPTGTDDLLGAEKWGAGPTGLLLKQVGGWTYGILANHIWSYAGDDRRAYVSSTFLQPFLSYTTKAKTTFGLNTESTYDWHNDQWTVPINISVSQLTRIGKLPVQFALGFKVYAEGPSGGPDWGLRFVVTPLFPTGGKPVASQTSFSDNSLTGGHRDNRANSILNLRSLCVLRALLFKSLCLLAAQEFRGLWSAVMLSPGAYIGEPLAYRLVRRWE